MGKGLPIEVDPMALARKGASYQGTINVSALTRLRDLLVEDKGKVEVELSFAQEEHLPAVMAGKINASLILTCQRCGYPMDYNITACPMLRIVATDEQAKNLSRDEEALVTRGGMVNLMELVEEEILLNLPMIAKHDDSDCRIQLPYEFS